MCELQVILDNQYELQGILSRENLIHMSSAIKNHILIKVN